MAGTTPQKKQTFWEKLRSFANGRVRKAYMDKVHHDRKCPRCQTWTSEVGGCAGMRDDGDWHELMKCNRCGYESRWFVGSMLPIIDDPLHPMEYVTRPTPKATG